MVFLLLTLADFYLAIIIKINTCTLGSLVIVVLAFLRNPCRLLADKLVIPILASVFGNLPSDGEVRQNAMAGEFTKMKQWEKDYNSYLKTATNYASALKAATHIYDDGVRILLTLGKLRKATSNNPQGIVATVSMNNLYMETTTEMLSVFTLLKNAVAKGGSTNMLTGAERSKTLWELEDKLSSFSHKLQLLYLSIRHYRMSDVWNRATAGMIERDKHDVAMQSLSHWKRYAKEVSLYSR